MSFLLDVCRPSCEGKGPEVDLSYCLFSYFTIQSLCCYEKRKAGHNGKSAGFFRVSFLAGSIPALVFIISSAKFRLFSAQKTRAGLKSFAAFLFSQFAVFVYADNRILSA